MTYINAHAAQIDENNIVRNVIVIPYMNDNDEEITNYCNSIGLPGKWIDTSYTGARRSKFAGLNYLYDEDNDVFIAPQPMNSWILNENFEWVPPVPRPNDGMIYYWDEEESLWKSPAS